MLQNYFRPTPQIASKSKYIHKHTIHVINSNVSSDLKGQWLQSVFPSPIYRQTAQI